MTQKASTKPGATSPVPKKIMAPQTLDQSDGEKVCGPDQIDDSIKKKGMVGLMEKISSQQGLPKLK